MDRLIRSYLSEIGRRGGSKSRRRLTSESAHEMVTIREAQKAFKVYYASCFWSFDPDYKIKNHDISWVIDQLHKHGNHNAYNTAQKLCLLHRSKLN